MSGTEKNIKTERMKNIEGFITNINFPGSYLATPTNTPSNAVYESRKLLVENDVLQEKIGQINKLGQTINNDVNLYKQQSNILMNLVNNSAPEEGSIKLRNIHINSLYTEAELANLIKIDILSKGKPAWAFERIYNNIPSNESYPVTGGLTLSTFNGSLENQPYLVSNQGQKLTYEQCKELTAQTGHIVFGMTNATLENGQYVSTCLVPTMEDVENLAKWGNVQDNNRVPKISVTSNTLVNIRDGNAGSTPLYSLQSLSSISFPSTNYYKSNNGTPSIGLVDIFSLPYETWGQLWEKYNMKSGAYWGNPTQPVFDSLDNAALQIQKLGYKYFQMFGQYNSQSFAYYGPNNDGVWDPDTRTYTSGEALGIGFGMVVALWIDGDVEGYINELKQFGSQAGDSYIYKGPYYQSIGYGNEIILPIAGSTAIWKITDDENDPSVLRENGMFNVSDVQPEMYLNRMQLSVSDWKSVQQNNSSNESLLQSWLSTTITNAKNNTNINYIGFFYNYLSDTTGQLVAFGSPKKGTSNNWNNNFTITDDNGIVYGDKNTIVYYLLTEKNGNGEYAIGRADLQMLGKVFYVDENNNLNSYPSSMLTPQNPDDTNYILKNNTTSDYFNINTVPLNELQNMSMTIPKCQALCNKYYDQCNAFVFDGDAEVIGMPDVVDGTIMPKCSLKSFDPTVFTWATKKNELSRLYTKIPQINNNSTCPKSVMDVPSSFIVSEQSKEFGLGFDYIGLDKNGNEIKSLNVGVDMTDETQCGIWGEYEKDRKTLLNLQNTIASNIEKYITLTNDLKQYNSNLIQSTKINKPMVDTAVKNFNNIMKEIQSFADSGEFRTDKYKTEMSEVSRKSYTYIYFIWLCIAIVIIFFAIRTIMNRKN